MIVTQPEDVTTTTGMDVQFEVMVSGESPTFQWQKDGTDITDEANTYSGTDTASLTVLSVADVVDEGQYRVVVSNTASSGVTSDPASLVVSELINF